MSEAVVLAVAQCGGIAGHADLLRLVTRHQVRAARRTGAIERIGQDRYALPGLDESRRAAAELCGTVSHRSAAIRHGWSIRSAPDRPDIIVPRSRDVSLERRRGRQVWWRELAPDEVTDDVTTELRTVIDCARDLPLEESLPVADSAVRSGSLTRADLLGARQALPRTHRRRATLVLEAATGAAANPFESVTRALSIEAVGPLFTPQLEISLPSAVVTPDLVSEDLRLVIEADSHEFHTSRSRIVSDCWRYDELTLAGWLVLRFSWVHVMFHQPWVRATIRRAVELRRAQAA